MQKMQYLTQKIAQITQHGKAAKLLISAAACTTFFALRYMLLKINNKLKKRPPHLFGLPFIGSLLTMILWKNDFRSKLLPEYGDIVSFNVGTFKMYWINDLDLIQALFSTAVDRCPLFSYPYKVNELTPPLSVCNNDENWSFRRKILLSSITKLLNQKKLEENITKILENVTYKQIDLNLIKNDKYLWYPRNCVKNAAFNVIYSSMFGNSLMVDDTKFVEYDKAEKQCLDNILSPIISKNLPKFIADLAGFSKNSETFVQGVKQCEFMVKQDFEKIINNSTREIDNDDDTRTEFSTLAEYLNNEVDEFDQLTYNRLISDIITLFFGGLDTTSHATEVGIILLAKHPDIQDLIFEELNNVYGNDNINGAQFNLSNVHKCAQFRAFINETLRISCGVPDGGCHSSNRSYRCVKWTRTTGVRTCTSKQREKEKGNGKDKIQVHVLCEYTDSKFDFDSILNDKNNTIIYDYVIENNCWIQANLAYVCHGNDKIWNLGKNAKDLNLNYWLKKDLKNGKLMFHNNRNSVPFGVGNRDCFGQSLARKELQAFLAHLILKYKIKAQNNDASSIDIKYGFGDITATVNPQIPVIISKR